MKRLLIISAFAVCTAIAAADVEKKRASPTMEELAAEICRSVDPDEAFGFAHLPRNRKSKWLNAATTAAIFIDERGQPGTERQPITVGQIYWHKWGVQVVQVEVVAGPDRGKYMVRFVELVESHDRAVDVRNPGAPRTKTLNKNYGNRAIVTADELMFGPYEDKITK